jgi:nucleotide-binding universal stress UspA family protein
MRNPTAEPGRIVVGVNRSAASRSAVVWAAREARIRHNVLLVTHVDPPSTYAPDLHDAATACHRLLAGWATLASETEPGVAVGTLLLCGSISDELISLSRSAALIVVGVDQDVPRAAHGAIGSIEDRVVVQANCPVVTVPAHPAKGDHGRYVAVGLTDDASGARALAAGVAEAAVRGAALTVVPGPLGTHEVMGRLEPGGSAEHDLRSALTAAIRQHPGMTVAVDWPVTDAVQTLISHSANASLVVIGSQHSDDRWSIRVGTAVGPVLRQASGPVMLIGGLSTTSTAHAPATGPTRLPEPATSALLAADRP